MSASVVLQGLAAAWLRPVRRVTALHLRLSRARYCASPNSSGATFSFRHRQISRYDLGNCEKAATVLVLPLFL
jgi:hypothetical protein